MRALAAARSRVERWRRFNMADRDRNKVRASLDWQALEALSVQAGVEYVDDNYTNSAYGLTSAKNWQVNLEATWQATEDFSANLWYTYQNQQYQSGGISYSAGQITNTATVGTPTTNTVVSGGCFSTVMDKNMNAKIDPCLNWNADQRDRVNSLGLGFNWNVSHGVSLNAYVATKIGSNPGRSASGNDADGKDGSTRGWFGMEWAF